MSSNMEGHKLQELTGKPDSGSTVLAELQIELQQLIIKLIVSYNHLFCLSFFFFR